ncbi:MAG: metallophosphoesterase [Pseudomonadota bacterium]
MATRLAHLTDVHLGPLPKLRFWDWNVKRTFGYANWRLRRHRVHRPEVVDLLLADLQRQRADHVLVSGDLTNIGLPEEHRAAARWLERLGPPEHVSVVPGNHDVYTRLISDPGIRSWYAYFHADSARDVAFPYVYDVGNITIIGLNSAVFTMPGNASGRIGRAQRERLAEALKEAADRQQFRLVMLHHPPLPGLTSSRRALRDADALMETLAEGPADLVIHGHNHRFMQNAIALADRKIPVIGAASCSVPAPGRHEDGASYHIYHISGHSDDGWHITLERRGLAADGRAVVRLSEFELGGIAQRRLAEG